MRPGLGCASEIQRAAEDYASEQYAGVGADPSYIPAGEIIPKVDDLAATADTDLVSSRKIPSASPQKPAKEASNYILNIPLEALAKVKAFLSGKTEETEEEKEYETATLALSSDEADEADEPEADEGSLETQTQALSPAEEGDGEYTIVDSGSKSYVYKDGKLVATFEADTENGVTILSAHEKAEQWVQNQHYENADLSYIYEESSFDDIDEDSSAEEMGQAVSEELDKTIEGYDDSDFYYYDENGYLVADEKRLQDWAGKVQLLCALLVILQMLAKAPQEQYALAKEALNDIKIARGLDTATIVGGEVQNKLACVSISFAELLQKASEHNKMIYDREVAAAEAANDSCGEQTWDVISGGENTIDALEGQKEAAEHYLKATQSILNLLQSKRKTSNKDEKKKEEENGKSTIDKTNAKLEEKEAELSAGLSSISLNLGNGYKTLDSEETDDLNRQFSATQNLKKILNMLRRAMQEMRNLAHEELTGLSGHESNQNAERLQDMLGSLNTQIFEMQANLTMQEIQLNNQVVYLGNQIEKAQASMVFNIIGNIFTVAAIVVAFIYPPAGLALGALAAGIKLLGSYVADSMSEDYRPGFTRHEKEVRDTDTGNKLVDALNAEANREDEVLAKVNEEDYLDPTDDDFYEVNYKKLAEAQKELSNLQNLRRVLVALSREKAVQCRIAHMELNGIGSYEPSEKVFAINESDFEVAQFKLQLLAFTLAEIKMAENIRITNEKQMDAALRQFWISLSCQVGGAALGSALGAAGEAGAEATAEAAGGTASVAAETATITAEEGFYLGWSLGGVIGGYISTLVNQITYGSYGASYGDDGVPAYLQSIRNHRHSRMEAQLAEEETEVYENALANGTLDAGNDYEGVNGAHLAGLRMQLGRIANVRSALAFLHAEGANQRNLAHQVLTGMGGRKAGDWVRSVIQAELEGSIKVFDYIVQYIAERVEVHNRAEDAAKAVFDASIKLAINGAIAIAGCLAGISNPMWIYAMTPVISLVNSCYDLVVNWVRSESGYGKLEHHDAEGTARQLVTKGDPDNFLSQMEQQEMEVYAQISNALIEELGGGRWGINSGAFALLRYQMESVYNVRNVFVKMREALAEIPATIRAILTGVGDTSSFAASVFGIDRLVALSNISTLMRNIQTRVERHNKMNTQSRALWQSLTGAAFAALNLYLACQSADNSLEMKKESQDFSETEKKLKELEKDYETVVKGGQVEGRVGATAAETTPPAAGKPVEAVPPATSPPPTTAPTAPSSPTPTVGKTAEAAQSTALPQPGQPAASPTTAPTAPPSTTVGATTAEPGKAVPAGQETPSTTTGQTKPETRESLEKKIEATKENMDKITDRYEILRQTGKERALYKFIAGLSEIAAVWLTGVIYDSCAGESRESKEADYKSQTAEISPDEKGWAASISRSETETVHYALSGGDTQLDTEAKQVQIQQNDELINGTWDATVSSANYVKDSREPDPLMPWLERRKKEKDQVGVPDTTGSSPAAGGTPPAAAGTAPVSTRQADLQALGNTKVLLERLEQLLKKVEEAEKTVSPLPVTVQETEAGVSEAQAFIDLLRATKPADLKAQLEEAKRLHQAALVDYNHAVQDLNAAKSKLIAVEQETFGMVREIGKQLIQLGEAICRLENNGCDPALIKALEDQFTLLKLKKEALKERVETLRETTVKRAEGKLADAQAKLQAAARRVNEIERKLAREARKEKDPGTTLDSAVRKIDWKERERRRSPHEMYQQAKEEKQVAESGSASSRSKIMFSA